ncbi:hypothetical protein AVEN_68984-1 [Araneus ventricosus]|uniref:Uncharacterized protein n=1 Tax=Araneus ventricosus TaxID=182803 RepID=A0A4Y2ATT4_ARAVE|nr:hypothetical protein AVEN_68984-1 [Araneus ventricosus]
MSLLDESRWKKHGERYATVITDDPGNAGRLRSSMRDREKLLFAACVDIDVYDASGNIVHIAGKSEFPMLRKKRQYKHRNGDYCVTSIFSDASKIGTVLSITDFEKRCIEVTGLGLTDLGFQLPLRLFVLLYYYFKLHQVFPLLSTEEAKSR